MLIAWWLSVTIKTGNCSWINNQTVLDRILKICNWSIYFLSLWSNSPTQNKDPSCSVFLDHTQLYTTVGWTPLDEGSVLTTQNIRKKQTSIPPAGFKPAISANAQPCTFTGWTQPKINCSWTLSQSWELEFQSCPLLWPDFSDFYPSHKIKAWFHVSHSAVLNGATSTLLPLPSNAEVKERVALSLCSPSRPSCPAPGRNLPFFTSYTRNVILFGLN